MKSTKEKNESIISRLKSQANFKTLVITLAAVVVFATTYLLILPAFTLDKDEAAQQGGIDIATDETAYEEDTDKEDIKTDEEASGVDKNESEDADKSESKLEPKEDSRKENRDETRLLTKDKTLTADKGKGDDFTISAILGKDAKVPEDVKLEATELENKTKEEKEIFEQYKKDALEALREESSGVKDIKSIRLYDISLTSEGETVEPSAAVNITINYDKAVNMNDADNIHIVHFAEQKTGKVEAEVLDNKKNNVETVIKDEKLEEASFDAESFSVYAVVGTETITNEEGVIRFEGDGFKIIVTYEKDAQIPLGTEIEAAELDPSSEEYMNCYQDAWFELNKEYLEQEEIRTERKNESDAYIIPEEERVKPREIKDARFFDIKFMFNGKEFEPKAGVSVKIEYDEGLDAPDGSKISAIHLKDDNAEIFEEVETEFEKDKVKSVEHVQKDFSPTGDITSVEVDDTANIKKFDLKAGGSSEDLGKISASKTVTPNTTEDGTNDGTYTLSLNVTGASKQQSSTEITKSNIIIVMDQSGSMFDNNDYEYTQVGTTSNMTGPIPSGTTYYGLFSDGNYHTLRWSNSSRTWQRNSNNQRYTGNIYTREDKGTRMAQEKIAVKAMIESLLGNNDPTIEGGADAIQIELIRFGGEAKVAAQLTNDEETLSDAVDGITDNNRGTNWEAALSLARTEASSIKLAQPDEKVFVIFLTDGQPTSYGDMGVGEYGDDYETYLSNAEDDARGIVADGHSLYNIFAYGSTSWENYLRRLTNYAYTGTDSSSTQYDGKYYYYAGNTQALVAIFENIIKEINNSLAYGNVAMTDGLSLGVTSTTVTGVNGSVKNFHYTVTNAAGTVYSARENDDDSVTFTVNGRDYPGTKATETINGTDYDYYYTTVGTETYKMALAAVDNGDIIWELSGIGTLVEGYTYSLSCVVWPNQDAYDLVANLNNGVVSMDWDPEIATRVVDSKGKEYFIGGFAEYPYIVRYSNGIYAAMSNTGQTTSYAIATTDEEGNTTYGERTTFNLEDPDPMGLTGSLLSITKKWEDDLDPSQLTKLINNAGFDEDGHPNYHITLNVKEDGEEYRSYTFYPVPETETDGSITYSWPSQDISISPAILVSENPGGTYKTAILNGTTYYVLNEGHTYTIEEDANASTGYNFEFSVDPYHPALVDGEMTNVEFTTDENGIIIDGREAHIIGDTPLETFEAENSLASELDITKEISDPDQVLTDAQENFETFTYKVTLTVPKGAENITAYEYVPRTGAGRFTINGYQANDDPDVQALADDVKKFNGKTFGQYTVTYPNHPAGDHTLNCIFTDDGNGKTKTGTLYITLKRDEIVRFTNLPTGTRYTVEEVYANLRQADPSRDIDAKPADDDPANNLEEQGYSVSVETKNGNPSVSQSNVVTGTINDPDTRYYNRFTNTLSDAAVVQLLAQKHLQGYDWGGERYYIKLTTKDDASAETVGRFTIEQKQMYLFKAAGETGDASYRFNNWVRFSKEGDYVYYIDEMSGETDEETKEYIGDPISGTVVNGITYDDQKKLIIKVEKVNGKLTITKITDGDGNVVYTTASGEETSAGYASFDANAGQITTLVTNKLIKISLLKIGDDDTSNKLSDVSFKLFSDAGQTNQVLLDARGNKVGTDIAGEDGTDPSVMTTNDDGIADIGVLNSGTYYLVETSSAPGYVQLAEAIEIKVAGNGVTYIQSNYQPSATKEGLLKVYTYIEDGQVKEATVNCMTGTTDPYAADSKYTFAGYRITINNSSGVELPMTGGIGTTVFYIAGILMILASVALAICRRKTL